MMSGTRTAASPLRVVRRGNPWLRVVTAPEHPSLRLVCFPSEGACAAAFSGWGDKLPPEVEILAVELPGRGSRITEVPRRQLAPVLEQLAGALSHVLSEGPVVFFGHRNGGFLAFAMAQYLTTRGLPVPKCLLISQTCPLSRSDRDETIPFRIPPLPPVRVQPLALGGPRPEESLSSEDLEELEDTGSVPPGVLDDPEVSGEVLAPLEADLALRSRWILDDAIVPVPIHLLVSEEAVTAHEARALSEGWSRWSAAGCALAWVPGGPRYVETQPRLFFDVLEDTLDARDASGVRRFPRQP